MSVAGVRWLGGLILLYAVLVVVVDLISLLIVGFSFGSPSTTGGVIRFLLDAVMFLIMTGNIGGFVIGVPFLLGGGLSLLFNASEQKRRLSKIGIWGSMICSLSIVVGTIIGLMYEMSVGARGDFFLVPLAIIILASPVFIGGKILLRRLD